MTVAPAARAAVDHARCCPSCWSPPSRPSTAPCRAPPSMVKSFWYSMSTTAVVLGSSDMGVPPRLARGVVRGLWRLLRSPMGRTRGQGVRVRPRSISDLAWPEPCASALVARLRHGHRRCRPPGRSAPRGEPTAGSASWTGHVWQTAFARWSCRRERSLVPIGKKSSGSSLRQAARSRQSTTAPDVMAGAAARREQAGGHPRQVRGTRALVVVAGQAAAGRVRAGRLPAPPDARSPDVVQPAASVRGRRSFSCHGPSTLRLRKSPGSGADSHELADAQQAYSRGLVRSVTRTARCP